MSMELVKAPIKVLFRLSVQKEEIIINLKRVIFKNPIYDSIVIILSKPLINKRIIYPEQLSEGPGIRWFITSA